LTWTRVWPEDEIVPSINNSRSPRVPDARMTADEHPTRTNASVGAPRNDESVASHATASNRLVLPSPLPPVTRVSPSGARGSEADV
jgi:hypothetical protein